MKVIIDNSNNDKVLFYLKIKNKWILEEKKNLKLPLIALLEVALKKYKKNFDDIDGMAVLVGQGRFTATRIATTTANILGYVLKIPVISILHLKNNADFQLVDNKFSKTKKGVYISAKYSGKPHLYGKLET